MIVRSPGRTPARTAVFAAIVMALPLTAGCSLLASGKHPKDTAYVARDVESLYSRGVDLLEKDNNPAAAAKMFDEVERQHPYSPWARRAQLMSAFAYYLGRDYTQAIQAAQRFLTIHPGNKDAPYAYYLVALCYYEQISDVDRDQKVTEEALTALQEIQRRYPTSEYAADAHLKEDLVIDHLAGKDMEIGRFYERSGAWLAAQLRFRNVVDKYQTTSHAPEALFRLTETSLALGIPAEAKKYAAVLGANYPGSPWYQRAFDLMNRKAEQVATGGDVAPAPVPAKPS